MGRKKKGRNLKYERIPPIIVPGETVLKITPADIIIIYRKKNITHFTLSAFFMVVAYIHTTITVIIDKISGNHVMYLFNIFNFIAR
jgi:hypothetical protein